MQLKDRVALVTGGAKGIGKVICFTLAREGASLVICDINKRVAQAFPSDKRTKLAKSIPLGAHLGNSKMWPMLSFFSFQIRQSILLGRF